MNETTAHTADIRDDSEERDTKELSLEEKKHNVKNSLSPLRAFSPYNYEDDDVPDSAIDYDDNGNAYITPTVVKTWKCHYYYDAQRKSRLASHIALGVAGIFLSIFAFVNGVAGGWAALIILTLLTLNVLFRFNGWALYKIPMPEIPVLSSLDYASHIKQTMDKSAQAIKQQEEEEQQRKEFEEFKKNNTITEFVTPVHDYREGNPSPATILTDWMNGVAHMTKEDLVSQSDRHINDFVATMLLKDNDEVWNDADVIDSISQLTSSHPAEWKQARDIWRSSES